jgi:hypothetical protein
MVITDEIGGVGAVRGGLWIVLVLARLNGDVGSFVAWKDAEELVEGVLDQVWEEESSVEESCTVNNFWGFWGLPMTALFEIAGSFVMLATALGWTETVGAGISGLASVGTESDGVAFWKKDVILWDTKGFEGDPDGFEGMVTGVVRGNGATEAEGLVV